MKEFIIHLRGYSFIENEQYSQFTFLFWREQLRNASRFTTHLPSYYSSYQTFSLFVDFFMTVIVVAYITPRYPQVTRFIDSALLHKVKDKFLGIHWTLLEFIFPIEPLLSNELLCGGRFKERDVGYNSFLLSLRSPKVSEDDLWKLLLQKQNKKQLASMQRSTIPATCAVMSSALQVSPLWRFQPKRTRWMSSTFSPSRNEVENCESKWLVRYNLYRAVYNILQFEHARVWLLRALFNWVSTAFELNGS